VTQDLDALLHLVAGSLLGFIHRHHDTSGFSDQPSAIDLLTAER
jgi:hypothetical protein